MNRTCIAKASSFFIIEEVVIKVVKFIDHPNTTNHLPRAPALKYTDKIIKNNKQLQSLVSLLIDIKIAGNFRNMKDKFMIYTKKLLSTLSLRKVRETTVYKFDFLITKTC